MIRANRHKTHTKGTLFDLLCELSNIVKNLKDGGVNEVAIKFAVGLGLTEPDKKGEYTKKHESELIKVLLNDIK